MLGSRSGEVEGRAEEVQDFIPVGGARDDGKEETPLLGEFLSGSEPSPESIDKPEEFKEIEQKVPEAMKAA